jgi:hypothetical protein
MSGWVAFHLSTALSTPGTHDQKRRSTFWPGLTGFWTAGSFEPVEPPQAEISKEAAARVTASAPRLRRRGVVRLMGRRSFLAS